MAPDGGDSSVFRELRSFVWPSNWKSRHLPAERHTFDSCYRKNMDVRDKETTQ